MDPADAVRSRRASKFGTDCLESLLSELDSTLRECNPFVTAYKMMHEVVREAEADHGEVQNIRMWLVSNVGDNVRYIEGVRVGANTSRIVHNEIAIVYSGQDDFPDMKRELCIYNRNSAATLINTLSPVCDPLCYTLLFPYGDRGYHIGLRTIRGKKVSERRFYLNRVSVRKDGGIFDPVLHCRKKNEPVMYAIALVQFYSLKYYGIRHMT